MHSLESLQATDPPTPEPPSDNPLLEAAGITCEASQAQDNGSDVTIRPQFGPALVPPKEKVSEAACLAGSKTCGFYSNSRQTVCHISENH